MQKLKIYMIFSFINKKQAIIKLINNIRKVINNPPRILAVCINFISLTTILHSLFQGNANGTNCPCSHSPNIYKNLKLKYL